MKVDKNLLMIGGGVALLGVIGLYVWKKGGVANAATAAGQAAGAAVVNVAGGVTSGAVGAVGSAVGLPTPSQTTTDASVARWLIDNAGHFEASKWSGAVAYAQALFMAPGSGTPPPENSPAGQQFKHLTYSRTDTGDETARLMARYGTSSPDTIYSGEPQQNLFSDPLTGVIFP